MMTAQQRWDQRQHNLPPAIRRKAALSTWKPMLREWERDCPFQYYEFMTQWEQCWGKIENYEPMKEAAK